MPTGRFRFGFLTSLIRFVETSTIVSLIVPGSLAWSAVDDVAEPSHRARVVLSTLDGEPLPQRWPLGIALGISVSDSIKGHGPGAVAWQITPEPIARHVIAIDSERIVLSSGTTPVTVTIRVAVAFQDTVAMEMATVSFIDPDSPDSPDGPVQPDDRDDQVDDEVRPVDPDPTDPRRFVRDLLRTHVSAHADRARLALALADNFDRVAGEVSRALAGAGDRSWLDSARLVQATTLANRSTLESSREPWREAFVQIGRWLDAEAAAGRLTEPTDYAALWPRIAQGFRDAFPDPTPSQWLRLPKTEESIRSLVPTP